MIGEQGRNLVFIFSLPRSGSTLLSTILGNHSSVSCQPEPWLLLRLLEVYGDPSPGKIFDDRLASLAVREFLTEAEFVVAARRFALQAYEAVLARTGGSVIVDKTPRYYHILHFIDELFPEARKIWLRRNPLDIASSYKTTWAINADSLFGDNLVPHSFDFLLGLPSLAAFFESKSPYKYAIRYEDLVAAPEKEVRKLAEFCGLDFEPSMLDICPTARGLQPLIKSELGDRKIRTIKGILHDSVGAWKYNLDTHEIQQLISNVGSQVFIDAGYAEIVTEHPEWFDSSLGITAQKQLREGLVRRFRANTIALASHPEWLAAQCSDVQARLAESEADRAARGEQIERLATMLRESEADRAARGEQIDALVLDLRTLFSRRAFRWLAKVVKWPEIGRLQNS